MNDQCSSASGRAARLPQVKPTHSGPEFSDARRPEPLQRVNSALAHLRLWPVWLRGQELGRENGPRDEFMTVFSHELRNSLGAVRSATWILRKELPGTLVSVKAGELIERQISQM